MVGSGQARGVMVILWSGKLCRISLPSSLLGWSRDGEIVILLSGQLYLYILFGIIQGCGVVVMWYRILIRNNASLLGWFRG